MNTEKHNHLTYSELIHERDKLFNAFPIEETQDAFYFEELEILNKLINLKRYDED